MIYFLLSLFFASLLSILFMVGRKLVLLKDGNYAMHEEVNFEIPFVKEVKYISLISLKRAEHQALVLIIKSYIRTSNFLKNNYIELKNRIKNINIRHYAGPQSIIGTEVSKIIKIASTYKRKISEITHRIKEEEKNL